MPNLIHLPIEEATLPDVLDAVNDRMERLKDLFEENPNGETEETLTAWKLEYLRLEPIHERLEDLQP